MYQSIRKLALPLALMTLLMGHTIAKAEMPKVTDTIADLKGKFLFVQNTDKAIIQPIKGEKGSYTITLEKVNPLVVYISDRPARKTGQLLIEQFLKLWESKEADSFKVNPPNVVVHSIQSSLFFSTQDISFGFVISNPIYNAKTKTLSYTAKALEGTPIIEEKQLLEHVSLFIDDVCLSCW